MIQHAGLGYRRDLAEDFLSLSDDSPIRFIEAAPENWLKMGGRARNSLTAWQNGCRWRCTDYPCHWADKPRWIPLDRRHQRNDAPL